MNMRKIYRKIAKKNNITVGEVKRDMQAAINDAYKNDSNCETLTEYQNKIPRKDKIPTSEELIRFVVHKVSK